MQINATYKYGEVGVKGERKKKERMEEEIQVGEDRELIRLLIL